MSTWMVPHVWHLQEPGSMTACGRTSEHFSHQASSTRAMPSNWSATGWRFRKRLVKGQKPGRSTAASDDGNRDDDETKKGHEEEVGKRSGPRGI